MKKGTIMKKLTEAYTYGRITAKAEAILEKYGVKSSVILEKFTNDLGNHLGALLIKLSTALNPTETRRRTMK